MTNQELQTKCIQQVRACIDTFNVEYDKPYTRHIDISFKLSGKTAGKASHNGSYVKLNMHLLQTYKEDFINDTVIHEVGHILAYHLYGHSNIAPHGKEWINVTKAIGYKNPTTCHSFKTKSTLKTFTYFCGCDTHELTSIRHNKILKGVQRYHCRKCKRTLLHESEALPSMKEPKPKPVQESSDTKVCKTCKNILSLDKFSKYGRKNGYRPRAHCKECTKLNRKK